MEKLTYNGNTVAGSNVIDLINDALRKRKTALAPTGWQMFSNVLRHANIPDFRKYRALCKSASKTIRLD